MSFKLSDAQHKMLADKIEAEFVAPVQGRESPRAIMLGGQPGAGKSQLTANAMEDLKHQGGAVWIDPDALRDYHPKYAKLMREDDKTAAAHVHEDASKWADHLLNKAIEKRANIVLDGTMGNAENTKERTEALRAAGYRIEVRVMAESEQVSQLGIRQRYEEQRAKDGAGRWVPPEIHDKAYDGLPKSLEIVQKSQAADKIEIQRRGGIVVYENALNGKDWQHAQSAAAELQKARGIQWTADRVENHFARWKDVDRMMQERNADPADMKQARDVQKAHAFALQEPKQVVEKYPDLVNAYATMKAASASEKTNNEAFLQSLKQNIVRRIGRGEELPAVSIREQQQQQNREQGKGPEQDRGR